MTLECIRLAKRYQNTVALDDFSAVFRPGVYGLLGANGAGKTTLINSLVGVLKPTGGRILVDGADAQKLGDRFLAQVGYLPQYPQFYRDFTVLEFLRYLCALKGVPKKDAPARIQFLLEAVNLAGAAGQKIGALSGGMRQRVGIAQAMLGDPKLLILDEPTAGLDPQERIRFRNLIVRFSPGRIVLLATHIVSDVDAIASEVLILKGGRLLVQQKPEALTQSLDGKVWELELENEGQLRQYEQYPVSRLQRRGAGLQLRLLAQSCPAPGARPTAADLEDAFLYYDRKGEEGDTGWP